MTSRLTQFCLSHRYFLSLMGIVLLLCLTNYTFGTFLTGWDNLHPEFNFQLNIYRSIFSVWEEYQGLGLLAGMGHAADLPRQIFLFLLSPLIPMSFSRYFFHFLMLFVGTSGVYYFIRYMLKHCHPALDAGSSPSTVEMPDQVRHDKSERFAFLGAIFYLLNLGTIQYFFVPFEPYSMFWGMFPWELFFTIRFLQHPTRSNFLWLALINLAATAQGYVQTVFLVYVIAIVLLLSSFVLYQKTWTMLKRSFLILVVIFCMNAFWVLPNLYFTVHDVAITQNAINNRQNTQRFFEQNKYHGTITDFPLLREFYIDFFAPTGGNSENDYMMYHWRRHFSNPLIALIGYGFFVIILLGIFSPLHRAWKTRQKQIPPLSLFFLFLMLLSMVIFLSDTILFAQINQLFRSLPLVNQIFRNPFTKFIVPTIFVFSIGFSLGCTILSLWIAQHYQHILTFLKKLRMSRDDLTPYLQNGMAVFAVLTFFILLVGLPAFFGSFFSPAMRITIPPSYFQLFDYFKTVDKNARIMNLPQGSYWGWGSYEWPGGGSLGSGFLWYGIEQPIMDRAFDVWSQPLENYYWQLWDALKKKDKMAFNTILDKYAISYVLFDSTYTPSDANPIKTLYLQQNDVLKKNPKVTLVKTFGTISLYKVNHATATHTITAATNIPTVAQPEVFQSKDMAAQTLGMYTSVPKDNAANYLFPFGSLFTGRFPDEQGFLAQDTSDAVIFKTSIPKGTYTLSYPAYSAIEQAFPVQLTAQKSGGGLKVQFSLLEPTIKYQQTPLPKPELLQEVLIPLPLATTNVILSVNGQDFFPFTLSPEQKVLGTTYFFNESEANTIRVYNATGAKKTVLDPKDFSAGKQCEPREGNVLFNAAALNNVLTLKSQNTNTCSVYQKALPTFLTNSLVQVSFDYTSSSDEFPQYCFANADGTGCLNTKKQNADTGFSEKGKVRDYFFTSDITDLANFQFRLNASDNGDKDTEKKISFKNITLTSYPVLASIVGDIPVVASESASFYTVASKTPAVLEVIVPKMDNSRSYAAFLDKGMYKDAASQPETLPNMGDSYLQTLSQTPRTLRLSATNTYAQFWLHVPKNHVNTGYILFMDTRNEHGFPLTVNVYSPSERNKYIYTMTEKTNTFQQLSYILPPQYPFDPGMELLFMSNSVNNDPSINDIRNVSAYPIPYDFLTNIMLQNTTYQPKPEQDVTSDLIVKKNSLAQYTVTVGKSLPKDTTVVLWQAYHEGWKAYQVQSSGFIVQRWLTNTLPMLFGKEIKDHVMVNNWANGWNIPSNFPLSPSPFTLVLVFWPQYLQWLGFLFLLLPFIGLIWYKARSE